MGDATTNSIPVWEKVTLTVNEAAAYSGIGINKIRELLQDRHCSFALRIGRRTVIKRKEFEKFITNHNTL